jgi:drug/metabolite transporter (DMT)-like permease
MSTDATPPSSPASQPAPLAPRRRVLEAGAGTSQDAFGGQEWLLLSGVAMIWGSSFLLMDIGLDSLRPGVIVMIRVLLGALTLSLVPAARVPVAREDRSRIALLGVVWVGIPLAMFPLAQQWISSSVAGMLNGAVPLTSALWAAILLRSVPGRRQMAGLVVGFTGIVAISWPGLQDADATALGTALVLFAVFLYGLATNLAVPLQQRYGALPVLLRAQLAALVIVVPYGLLSLPGSRAEVAPMLAMIPLGLLGTAVAFVLMTTLVGRVGAPRGAVAIYFVPVVAVVLGVAFRGDKPAAIAFAGTALVILGAWLTSRRER